MQAVIYINNSLRNKLQSLVAFLSQINKGFDAVAEEVDNANLKTAMMAIAVESKQYAKEISEQLNLLHINTPTENDENIWTKIEASIYEQAGAAKGDEIIALCNNCESYFSKFYEEALQEYFPYKNLKDIITYQLYAAQCAFMKIRLLNNLRFSN